MKYKFLSLSLASIVFVTHVVLGYAPEANFWKQRMSLRGSPDPRQSIAADSAERLPRRVAPRNDHIIIPQQFGTIRHITKGTSEKTIIHIQDVHMNAEAQHNIAGAIQGLIEADQVDLIALEGAFGPIHISQLKKIPQQESVHQVADYLFRENKISGPILAAFKSAKDIPAIVGIDDKTHYDLNVQAVKDSGSLKEKLKAQNLKLKINLNEQKARVFNRDLLEFDNQVQVFRNENISMGEYAALLNVYSSPRQGGGQEGGDSRRLRLNPTPTPSPRGRGTNVSIVIPTGSRAGVQLSLFTEAYSLEKSINFSKVEHERAILIKKLIEQLTSQATKQLLKMANAFKSGNLNHADFYSYLHHLCEKNHVSLKRFPAMRDYLQYVLLSDSIDGEKLQEELESKEKEIYEQLAKTEEEKELIQISRQNYLEAKLLDFALSKREWDHYMSLRGPLGVKQSKIATLSPLGFARNDIISFERFYMEATQRDQKMAQNLQAAIKKYNAKNIVLVTGGFHSEGIKNKLLVPGPELRVPVPGTQDAGPNIITFIPKISKVDTKNGSAYLSVFSQEKSPLDKLFAGEKLFLALPPVPDISALSKIISVAQKNGAHVFGQFGSWVLHLTRNNQSQEIENVWIERSLTSLGAVGVGYLILNQFPLVKFLFSWEFTLMVAGMAMSLDQLKSKLKSMENSPLYGKIKTHLRDNRVAVSEELADFIVTHEDEFGLDVQNYFGDIISASAWNKKILEPLARLVIFIGQEYGVYLGGNPSPRKRKVYHPKQMPKDPRKRRSVFNVERVELKELILSALFENSPEKRESFNQIQNAIQIDPLKFLSNIFHEIMVYGSQGSLTMVMESLLKKNKPLFEYMRSKLKKKKIKHPTIKLKKGHGQGGHSIQSWVIAREVKEKSFEEYIQEIIRDEKIRGLFQFLFDNISNNPELKEQLIELMAIEDVFEMHENPRAPESHFTSLEPGPIVIVGSRIDGIKYFDQFKDESQPVIFVETRPETAAYLRKASAVYDHKEHRLVIGESPEQLEAHLQPGSVGTLIISDSEDKTKWERWLKDDGKVYLTKNNNRAGLAGIELLSAVLFISLILMGVVHWQAILWGSISALIFILFGKYLMFSFEKEDFQVSRKKRRARQKQDRPPPLSLTFSRRLFLGIIGGFIMGFGVNNHYENKKKEEIELKNQAELNRRETFARQFHEFIIKKERAFQEKNNWVKGHLQHFRNVNSLFNELDPDKSKNKIFLTAFISKKGKDGRTYSARQLFINYSLVSEIIISQDPFLHHLLISEIISLASFDQLQVKFPGQLSEISELRQRMREPLKNKDHAKAVPFVIQYIRMFTHLQATTELSSVLYLTQNITPQEMDELVLKYGQRKDGLGETVKRLASLSRIAREDFDSKQTRKIFLVAVYLEYMSEIYPDLFKYVNQQLKLKNLPAKGQATRENIIPILPQMDFLFNQEPNATVQRVSHTPRKGVVAVELLMILNVIYLPIIFVLWLSFKILSLSISQLQWTDYFPGITFSKSRSSTGGNRRRTDKHSSQGKIRAHLGKHDKKFRAINREIEEAEKQKNERELQNPQNLYNQGNKFKEQGNYLKAEAMFKKAYKIFGDAIVGLFVLRSLAYLYYDWDKQDDKSILASKRALSAIKKFRQKNKNKTKYESQLNRIEREVRLVYALSLRRQGEDYEAVKILMEPITLSLDKLFIESPLAIDIYLGCWAKYILTTEIKNEDLRKDSNEFEVLLEKLTGALDVHPDVLRTLELYVRVYMFWDQDQKAIYYANKTLNLIETLKSRDMLGKKDIETIRIKSINVHNIMATLLDRAGQINDAIAMLSNDNGITLKNFLVRVPSSIHLLGNLIRSRRTLIYDMGKDVNDIIKRKERKRYSEAESLLKEIISLEGESVKSLRTRGKLTRLYLAWSKWGKAIRSARRNLRLMKQLESLRSQGGEGFRRIYKLKMSERIYLKKALKKIIFQGRKNKRKGDISPEVMLSIVILALLAYASNHYTWIFYVSTLVGMASMSWRGSEADLREHELKMQRRDIVDHDVYKELSRAIGKTPIHLGLDHKTKAEVLFIFIDDSMENESRNIVSSIPLKQPTVLVPQTQGIYRALMKARGINRSEIIILKGGAKANLRNGKFNLSKIENDPDIQQYRDLTFKFIVNPDGPGLDFEGLNAQTSIFTRPNTVYVFINNIFKILGVFKIPQIEEQIKALEAARQAA